MASLAVSHELIYLVAHGTGDEFAQAMQAGGHDGYWFQFALTIAGVTLALSAVAVRQLHRLRHQADAVSAGRLVVRDTGRRILARMTGQLWLLIAGGTVLAYVAQENIEVFAMMGRLPGLDVVTGAQIAAIPVIALTSLVVAVVGGLMRWRRHVLLARIRAALAPIRRTPAPMRQVSRRPSGHAPRRRPAPTGCARRHIRGSPPRSDRPMPPWTRADPPITEVLQMLHRIVRALISAALLGSIAVPVFAHAEFKTATPGPGDTVTGSPPELVVRFTQDLDPSKTTLEVRDASGNRIVRGGEAGAGPREFRLPLPALEPGDYEVRWTSSSSEDGEIARGTYTFEVVAAPTPTPTPAAAPSATTEPSASTSAAPTVTPVATTTAPSPTPAASAQPDPTTTSDGSVLIPIVVVLLAVLGIGALALRRSRAG